MKRQHLLFITGLLIVSLGFAFTRIHRTVIKNTTANTGFALIELYTSEGCSSCPPADKLLAKIEQEYKDKEVYVLAYHVDYWNHLGWKDAFSSPQYSQRQRDYSRYLKLDGVYTPQAIVNGCTEFVGSDEGKMRGAIQQGLAKGTTTALAINNVKISGDKVALQYQVSGAQAGSSLMLAVIEKHAQSQVKAGENKGKMLPHINIVQKLQTIGLKNDMGNAVMNLPGGFNVKEWDIIGFVQNNRSGEIQAVRKISLAGKELAAIK